MANSKYEYVKSFETGDEILFPSIIVLIIDGRGFRRFSEVHDFEKPHDVRALHLMNSCAISVAEEFTDIVFSYGFSDEHSFVFKKSTQLYQRRASKILSLVVSFFTSCYVSQWKDFFPQLELQYTPSFHGRVSSFATKECLQEYLTWRQYQCHVGNQYVTCLWMMVKSGVSEEEANEYIKGTRKQDKHDLLFQKFELNYNDLPQIFRQGSCILKKEIEEVVKYNDHGIPIIRMRKKHVILHTESISASKFWNEQSILIKELGSFCGTSVNLRKNFLKTFPLENPLMPSTWIVIRIDGSHFHRFADIHKFEKPNDVRALNLMNSCAKAIFMEFKDVVFGFGVSDEYSFVLQKNSQFYHRLASKIVSTIVSYFSATFVMEWGFFFPNTKLIYPPHFDARAVCYPSNEILKDYLRWRQVDCHINNQYNTCFWTLVKSGKTKAQSQHILKGTQTQQKNELLKSQFGIEYSDLPDIFRHGSSVYKKKGRGDVIVAHCNVIEESFWETHGGIIE